MSGRYLLDTSILIALFADETAVKEKLAQASEVFIPSIAVGELYYGAWKSQITSHSYHPHPVSSSASIYTVGAVNSRLSIRSRTPP
jgi:predicted nucleic acid-binding protein